MMRFSIITIQADMVSNYLAMGVCAAATAKGAANFEVINLRDYAIDRHGTVDGRAYGGGDGMILRPEPLSQAVESIKNPQSQVVLLSAHGQRWNQQQAQSYANQAKHPHIILICGRFGGVDQRFIDIYVDRQISMGDYILSGGELAALAITDSIVRLLPGVLGNRKSSLVDSFSPGLAGALEGPQYTRPEQFQGRAVPMVLMSGNHKDIHNWQQQQSTAITKALRPDLLNR